MDRALTIKQVADLLAVRPETVRKLVNSGLLTGRRIGQKTGSIRVLESDLKAYLDSTIIQPPPDVARKPARVKYPASMRFKFFPLET